MHGETERKLGSEDGGQVQTSCAPDPPSTEEPTNGRGVDRGDGRDRFGVIVDPIKAGIGLSTQWKRENTGALVAGHRADVLVKRPEIAAVIDASYQRILQDHGNPDVAFMRESAARSAARIDFLLQSAFDQLVTTGSGTPFSSRGKVRHLFKVFLELTDRQVAYCRLLGMTRVPKRGPNLQDVIASIEAKKRADAAENGGGA